jgi:hypothetical protein|tara:strand:- start:1420 stop:1701 length:282 start_codon:yes stop_codon:yes gene_type:complete
MTNQNDKAVIDILNIIQNINSNEDMSIIVDAIKEKRNQLHQTKAKQFKFEDKVYFIKGKKKINAMVLKVKQKFILVQTDNGEKWNVPALHLFT